MAVTKAQAQKLIGNEILADRKDGSRITGKLVRIARNRLVLERLSGNGQQKP